MSAGVALLGLSLPAASDHAEGVDSTLTWLLAASAAAVIGLGTLTLFFLVRYRSSSKADRTPVRASEWKLETAWTLATLAVFLAFFWKGALAYLSAAEPPLGAEAIQVTGRQWMWDVRYPDGRREFNALHLRLGQAVRLVLRSEDVIHSFFVPAFRVKEDLVPGKVTSMWLRPTRTGDFTLYCAQYCGTAHADMTGTVTVLDAGAFDRWKSERTLPTTGISPAARGRKLYLRYGCGQCHDGPDWKAPSLAGLFGSEVTRTGQARAVADESFLHDAILHARRLPGYKIRMPSYAGIISEADAADLVAYIVTLRAPGEPGSR
jgi:cytochrome c oxidase subunit 2